MRSLVCADANLALKIVLHEPDSARARALWEEWKAQQTLVIAPTLWGYEVTSVVRKRAHRGLLPPDIERETLAVVHQLPVPRPASISAPGSGPGASTGRLPTTRTTWPWRRWPAAHSGPQTSGCSAPSVRS